MASEMVERVALAMYVKDGFAHAFGTQETWQQESWERDRESVREDYLRRAVAAIDAMREPTPAMLEAVEEEHMYADGIWRAMIGGAL